MESLDKDEGYISPLEAFDSRSVYSRKKTTLKRAFSNSWARASENQDCEDESCNSSFITEIVENSGTVLDSLWLTLPESQAGRMPGISEDDSAFQSSGIVGIVRSFEKVRYIGLNEFIRDTVDLLCGKPSRTYVQEDKSFRKKPEVLVHGLTPTAISNYSAGFLQTGSSVVKLSEIDEYFHFQSFVLESASNVCVSFVKFIKDFLTVYQTIVMVKRDSIKSLTGLRTFFLPFQQQIQTLGNIVEEQVFASPVLLLKNLNDFMLKTEVPWISDVLQNLLVSCASAYSRYVSDWIFRGQLRSPLEFHITKNRGAVSQNRKFWTHQFAQNDDIPLFLKKFKNYMFDTGRVVNLIGELETGDLPTCFDHDTDLFIELKLSHENVVKLLLDHQAKLSKFLQEFSYLQAEIEDTVSKTTKENLEVDQAVVQTSASEFVLRHESSKLQKFLDEQEVKQSKMALLLQEMEEARHTRVRQAIDDLFEEKEANRVREEMERLETKRGYELIQKYYGEFVTGFIVDGKTEIDARINALSKSSLPEDCITSVLQTPEHPLPLTTMSVEARSDSSRESNVVLKKKLLKEEFTKDEGKTSPEKSKMSMREMGAGDYCGQNGLEDSFTEDIDTEDFQVKPINPFQLNLQMFDKPLVPGSSSESDSESVETSSSETPTEECDAFLTNRFLSLSVEIPLMTHHKMVNLALLHHIIVTKQLFRHVKIIQDYILLQNGLFGQFLCGKLIDRVKSGLLRKKEDIPGQIFTLNHCMDEVLQFTAESDELVFLEQLKFDQIEEVPSPEKSPSAPKPGQGLDKKKKQTITSEYEVLNSLCLRYTVDWPLNIFFTVEFFQKYQSVFTLQMQLYRSEILLEKTAKILKCKTAQSPQLNELLYCRYVMLHFVRSLRSYINVTVIHSSWSELTSSFSKMDSVEKIYELLVYHIKTVISNCLLGPKARSVMKLITSQLTVIESFCGRIEIGASNINWAKGEKIPPKEFKILIQTFKVFREIEKVFVQGASPPVRGIREFAAALGISIAEQDLIQVPKAQIILERMQKYMQPQFSPTPVQPTKRKKLAEPERHRTRTTMSRRVPEDVNRMSFEEALKIGKMLAEGFKQQTVTSLLPTDEVFSVGHFAGVYHAGLNLLKFRLSYLKNISNYINNSFPRFVLLSDQTNPPETYQHEVSEQVKQVDTEIVPVVLKAVEELNEVQTQVLAGVKKIQAVSQPNEEDDIIGTEERLEEVQRELMKQIKLLLVEVKQEGKIRAKSQDFIAEVIKAGTIPKARMDEVDPHVTEVFVNQMQLLRLRKTGRGKQRLALVDFSN